MKKHALGLLGFLISAWVFAQPASAQQRPERTAATPTPAPANAGGAPGSAESSGEAPPHAEEKLPEPKPRRRLKALQTTVGVPPTAQDVGSEADLLAGGRTDEAIAVTLNKWTLKMKGYVRAPIRVGIGPRNDGEDGNELHVPPRIVGLSSGTWEYIALAPNPSVSMYFNYGNPLVSANVIFNTNTMIDAGYRNLDQIGGISAAYITLKFPNAFGESGGLSWTVGAFGNRYGLAGPRGTSSGYYGTYLFGRTHQTGEVLTANLDLTDRMQIILEHGVGAKLEVIPFIKGGGPEADYLQGQGKGPQGSTFLHHAHVGLIVDDWFKVGYHYLTSWTPNDLDTTNDLALTEFNQNGQICRTAFGNTVCRDRILAEPARLSVFGMDLHVDGDRMGNGYIGYSHTRGENLYPLGDAVQAIHASTGRSYKENYFGRKDPTTGVISSNDGGTIDTLLTQYIFRLSSLLDRPFGAREITLAAYGMYNKARSPKTDPDDEADLEIDVDKLKFGGEIQLELHRHMTAGFRYDRVIPNLDEWDELGDRSSAYSAISPRLIFYTKRKSKEYVILNYTHYYLGERAFPGSPYADIPAVGLKADADMVMLSAIMSFGP
jgi:hypothetical protein